MNKQIIKDKLQELGYNLGCYSKEIDTLSKPQLKKVLDGLKWETFKFNTRTHTIYGSTVDNEKDVQMLPKSEYKELFGFWD